VYTIVATFGSCTIYRAFDLITGMREYCINVMHILHKVSDPVTLRVSKVIRIYDFGGISFIASNL